MADGPWRGRPWHVRRAFTLTWLQAEALLPELCRLMGRPSCDLQDVFLASYGAKSDEAYALQAFLSRYGDMGSWDHSGMWNDCCRDSRLYRILREDGRNGCVDEGTDASEGQRLPEAYGR